MSPFWTECFANPSSVHRLGQVARRAVEDSRENVLRAIGALGGQVVFTSGATEANNLAIRSVMHQGPPGRVLTTKLEHPSVLEATRQLKNKGFQLDYVKPDSTGTITAEAVQRALKPDTSLVALMYVNSETGVVTDIAKISEITRKQGILLFCDAVQAFGSLDLNVVELGVDILSLSGHKIYGPKGVGVLYFREDVEIDPILFGGSQEQGIRPGTINTPAVVGMGSAALFASQDVHSEADKIRRLRDRFENNVSKAVSPVINGRGGVRSPKHSNLYFRNVDGQSLLMNLDLEGISASIGSACSAGSFKPSQVLTDMGMTPDEAMSSVRFSFGRGITEVDVDRAVERVVTAVNRSKSG
jgi:cysteine desulfurase|tara:strand:+ start:41740 stop:42810 length:1071 start_codon:yes stop_codon:yes gene_type:complete